MFKLFRFCFPFLFLFCSYFLFFCTSCTIFIVNKLYFCSHAHSDQWDDVRRFDDIPAWLRYGAARWSRNQGIGRRWFFGLFLARDDVLLTCRGVNIAGHRGNKICASVRLALGWLVGFSLTASLSAQKGYIVTVPCRNQSLLKMFYLI